MVDSPFSRIAFKKSARWKLRAPRPSRTPTEEAMRSRRRSETRGRRRRVRDYVIILKIT
ncbi:hypothetical protein L914_01162 [Phytophthora nicotianae]|uniref:Uncharacterized protein n=2 Tax=Phytophthora nicotianae TaxID=4792 RepID=V9FXD2_PHYNI|nr:hypothetical protein F443_01239 [Phytophthora nicotianae P1569]ETM55644.1 hypothetical protein L914_01162 [Phytophthora nicotianae]